MARSSRCGGPGYSSSSVARPLHEETSQTPFRPETIEGLYRLLPGTDPADAVHPLLGGLVMG